ncbi:hypothetical protein [Maritalea myrionectae]|uniref:hypothetical protein n=1 Tax=Maritalea myrionectae TaxID=454601 RepID=UPI00040FBC86|nr:hypothetical protein [Maritalea myrionectae]
MAKLAVQYLAGESKQKIASKIKNVTAAYGKSNKTSCLNSMPSRIAIQSGAGAVKAFRSAIKGSTRKAK